MAKPEHFACPARRRVNAEGWPACAGNQVARACTAARPANAAASRAIAEPQGHPGRESRQALSQVVLHAPKECTGAE
jgi:hypothetical protein